MSFFNQLKNKAEELNKKHNILPFGRGQQSQAQHGAPTPHGNYPGQSSSYYHPGQPQAPVPPLPPRPGPWQQQQQRPQPAVAHGDYYPEAPPPPVPFHSRPPGGGGGSIGALASGGGAPATPRIYWRPSFSPEEPVGREFEQKRGHGEPWGWGNGELQNYTDQAANSFHRRTAAGAGARGRELVVRAVARPGHADPEARFTSARLVSRATLGRAEGCLTARLTLPCAPGVWPAFWLLPREPFDWPREGEVDVAETWDGDRVSRACLHWGRYDGGPAEAAKHLVRETRLPDMPARAVRFDFAWCRGGGPGAGAGGAGDRHRLMWYVDGRPVMRALMPPGARPIADWCVLLNVAMGGNVCRGKVPPEGVYDMVVHDLYMSEAPEGGWGRFDVDWQHCVDGAVM